MQYVTREQFLALKKLETRDVEIPGVGTSRVREPNRLEWDEFDKSADHFAARLVEAFAVDAGGKRLFQDGDITKLLVLGTGKIERAAYAIMDLAGLTESAQAALAKNFETTPTPGSSSD